MNYYFFQIIIISKYFKVYSGWFSAARILFLGNQNFEESQFENNKQLNKKIYLRLLYSVYGKKFNSNSILQNLKFLKLHDAILNAFQNEVMQMTAQTQRHFFNKK